MLSENEGFMGNERVTSVVSAYEGDGLRATFHSAICKYSVDTLDMLDSHEHAAPMKIKLKDKDCFDSRSTTRSLVSFP